MTCDLVLGDDGKENEQRDQDPYRRILRPIIRDGLLANTTQRPGYAKP